MTKTKIKEKLSTFLLKRYLEKTDLAGNGALSTIKILTGLEQKDKKAQKDKK